MIAIDRKCFIIFSAAEERAFLQLSILIEIHHERIGTTGMGDRRLHC